MWEDAWRNAGDDVFVVDEAEVEVAHMAIAPGDEVKISDARLAISVEAVDGDTLGKRGPGGRKNREGTAQAVAGDPKGLPLVLKGCDVGEDQLPNAQEADSKAFMGIAYIRPAEAVAEGDLLGVKVGHPIEQLVGAGAAKGDDHGGVASRNEDLYFTHGMNVNVIEAATRDNRADACFLLVCKIGSIGHSERVKLAPACRFWIECLERIEGFRIWRRRWHCFSSSGHLLGWDRFWHQCYCGLHTFVLRIGPLELDVIAGDLLEVPSADIADFAVVVVIPALAGDGVGNGFAEFVGACAGEGVEDGLIAEAASAGGEGHDSVEDVS